MPCFVMLLVLISLKNSANFLLGSGSFYDVTHSEITENADPNALQTWGCTDVECQQKCIFWGINWLFVQKVIAEFENMINFGLNTAIFSVLARKSELAFNTVITVYK